MRIAYVVNQYPKISHSFIRREILALERCGISVMRLALRGWADELRDPEDSMERRRTRYVLQDGIFPVVVAFMREVVRRPYKFMRALRAAWTMSLQSDRAFTVHLIYLAEACRIAGWLRTAGIQHVHAHFGTNSCEVTMLVGKLGGPPWSVTIHGPEEFDKAPVIGLAKKIMDCKFAVAISSYGRSQLYRNLAFQDWPKVHLVRCGVDPGFSSNETPPIQNTKRLVCVGRLSEQKGQLLLIQAVKTLVAEGETVKLVLVGDGELRQQIEHLIAGYHLEHCIEITGWMAGSEVRDQIVSARALLAPSFAEGLPVVIMEAMALCRPVIATFVGGIPELVRPGIDGWLIPAGDLQSLTDAIRQCLHVPMPLLARMGAEARERVGALHDVDVEAGKLAALFADSLNLPR